jgi:Ni/Co efflux regulator RcnB
MMIAGQPAFAQSEEEWARNTPNYDQIREQQLRYQQWQQQGGYDNRYFGRNHDEERRRGRGVGPNYAFYRGDRLPPEYRHRNYVVNDWRSHRLSAPPHGYHWVQSGNDYILIAIATGVIAQLILGQ